MGDSSDDDAPPAEVLAAADNDEALQRERATIQARAFADGLDRPAKEAFLALSSVFRKIAIRTNFRLPADVIKEILDAGHLVISGSDSDTSADDQGFGIAGSGHGRDLLTAAMGLIWNLTDVDVRNSLRAHLLSDPRIMYTESFSQDPGSYTDYGPVILDTACLLSLWRDKAMAEQEAGRKELRVRSPASNAHVIAPPPNIDST